MSYKSVDAPSQQRADDMPATVGKYRVDSVIGRGAMGVVYKGFDPQIDRPVAIKTLRLELLEDLDRQTLLARFAAEARAAGRCVHPNIVTVFDYVEQEGAPHIVMEYVDAGTLDAVIKSGSLPPLAQVGEIMAQLLSALGHAHDQGVIHRDVKPTNILCPGATTVKITDFGVARFDALGLTRSGAAGAIGTPNYMSPEQFLGRGVDARTDIFSAGVILYQLLTGERPFAASSIPELMRKLMNDPTPAPKALRPELPDALDAMTRAALARHPEERPESAKAFAEAMAAAIAAAGGADADAPRLDLTILSRSGGDARGAPEEPPSARGAPTSLSQTMAERLTPESLLDLERALARSVGPIAKHLLKRAAGDATDPDRLVSTLTNAIPSEREAQAFREAAERTLKAKDELTSVRLEATVSDAELATATRALTPFMGPMAKILARRVAAKALGRDDFHERLAAEIPTEPDRKAFLAAVRGAS